LGHIATVRELEVFPEAPVELLRSRSREINIERLFAKGVNGKIETEEQKQGFV
jgi:hypothetical protein